MTERGATPEPESEEKSGGPYGVPGGCGERKTGGGREEMEGEDSWR